MHILVSVVGELCLLFLVWACVAVFAKIRRARAERLRQLEFEEYKKSPQYNIDREREERKYIAYLKQEKEEEARLDRLDAERQAQKDRELEELKSQLRAERQQLAVSDEEQARTRALRRRVVDDLIGLKFRGEV